MNKPVILLGNGGHASVLIDILNAQGREIIGYAAPLKSENSNGLQYLGTDTVIDNYNTEEVEIVIGFGSVAISDFRNDVYNRYKEKGFRFANIIHPSAIISPSAMMGEGVQIMAGSVIQANTKIGNNVIVNTRSSIDHDCIIGNHTHIAPGVTLSGGVRIEEHCHIGTGATVIQGISIGKRSLVGAGSVVVKDVEEEKKVYGVPAKEV